MNKNKLKEQCIKMFMEGKSYTEIAKLTGWSRKYITDLIKDDKRVKEEKNNKKLKVYKRKNSNQMLIYIPTDFIEKLNISKDRNKEEYVNVVFDNNNNSIVIKKHK